MKHIWINEEVKSEMDKLKTHKRETYGDTVKKLLKFYLDDTLLKETTEEGKVTDTKVPPSAKEEEVKVDISPEVEALVKQADEEPDTKKSVELPPQSTPE